MCTKIIDEIEAIRSKNNINWMNLVRLAFEVAPDRAKQIMREIVDNDNKITELARKLAE